MATKLINKRLIEIGSEEDGNRKTDLPLDKIFVSYTISPLGTPEKRETKISDLYVKSVKRGKTEIRKVKSFSEFQEEYKKGNIFIEETATQKLPAKGEFGNVEDVKPYYESFDIPESYESTEKLLDLLGFKVTDLKVKENLNSLRDKLKSVNVVETATKLEVGEMTLTDIIDELSKPGRDPREDMPKPVLRSDVLKFEDLTEGMVLTGTVRNVIDFGAFVDIGVKYDGLVHISEMSNSYVKSPSEVVSVGDVVKVKVIKLDQERKKVGLSMKI